jgi:hypothetical protein
MVRRVFFLSADRGRGQEQQVLLMATCAVNSITHKEHTCQLVQNHVSVQYPPAKNPWLTGKTGSKRPVINAVWLAAICLVESGDQQGVAYESLQPRGRDIACSFETGRGTMFKTGHDCSVALD